MSRNQIGIANDGTLPNIYSSNSIDPAFSSSSSQPQLPSLNTSTKSTVKTKDDGVPKTPRRSVVKGMATFEIMEELRKRGKTPTGFPADDKSMLKEIFQSEYAEQCAAYDAYMKEVNRNKAILLERDRLIKKHQRRDFDQKMALQKKPQIVHWMERVKEGTCQPRASWSNSKMTYARYIFQNLPHSSPLMSLQLTRNGIYDEPDFCEILQRVLSNNVSLRRLDLSNNHLGPLAAVAIGEALKVNQTLQFLDLEGNDLQDGESEAALYGPKCLGDMLAVNSTLLNLNIMHCKLSAEGKVEIGRGAKVNDGLIVLLMDMALLDLKCQQGVMHKLESNRKHKRVREAAGRSARRRAKKEQIRIEIEEAKKQAKLDEIKWLEEERRNRIVQRWADAREERKENEERERQLELQRIEAEQKALEDAKGKKRKGKKKKGKKKKKK